MERPKSSHRESEFIAKSRNSIHCLRTMQSYSRLTLERQHVYGWTMYPGYGDYPYRSPIVVEEICPRGGRTLDLRFLNIFYAAGVQEMTYRLRTLRRERSFYIAEALEIDAPSDRVVVIEPMSREWIKDLAPNCIQYIDVLFDNSNRPDPFAFKTLMATI